MTESSAKKLKTSLILIPISWAISEMAQDMGISINEVFSFLAEDSVIDLELLEDLNEIEIPNKCSLNDLKNALLKKKLC